MKHLVSGLLLCICGAAWAVDDSFTSTDHRIPIKVAAKERNRILYEMREFLHGWHNIHHALARGDLKAVALEAEPMAQAMQRIPAGTRERFPEGFMQMDLAMREAFGQLAKAAGSGAGDARIQEQIAEITTYCSGCHDTYRFEVVRPKPARR